MKKSIRSILLLTGLMFGCTPAVTAVQVPTPAVSTNSPAPTNTPVPTNTAEPTATPDPFPDPTIRIVGEEEVVFDWSQNRCQAMNIPDLPARAFRDADGQVNLLLSHFTNYRMIGPELDQLKMDCNAVMLSQNNPDPALYSDAEWIAAPYTEDGQTIYAVVHDEYHGHEHPGQCSPGDRAFLLCWYNALTLVISTDGGASYSHVSPPPSHLVAGNPLRFEGGIGPYGMMSPSNIVKGKDGYYYEFVKFVSRNSEQQWSCLMRTQDLSDPASWRYWDGRGFEGQFTDPYLNGPSNSQAAPCPAISFNEIAGPLVESLTYNTELNRYVLVGISAFTPANREVWGFYYSFSEDLIHWTPRKLLVEVPLPWTVNNAGSDLSYLYPALLDSDSESRNFETTDKTAYLYYTRHNHGQGNLDRDLIRVPVEFFPTENLGPAEIQGFAWEFETSGDTEGWTAWNQLAPLQVSEGKLITEALGEDPFMGSGKLAIDARALPIIEINMKVSAGSIGQIFFITNRDTGYDEAKSLRFDIRADGEFHTYSLDMSKVPGWKDLITEIRFDPTIQPGTIEVDYIRLVGK